MAFQSILAPVTGSSADDAVLETAIHVASRFGGHIDALHVERERPAFPTGGEVYSASQMREVTKHFREQTDAQKRTAKENFHKIVDSREILLCDNPPAPRAPSASWHEVAGADADIVTDRGRVYDLTVVPRPNSANREASREMVEAALFGTGRPVLVAPQTSSQKLGDVILVGWNRTVQSAHAIAGAMPFLESAERVVVFMVATGAKQGPSPDDIARSIAWNGVNAEVREVPPEGRSVGRTLLEEANTIGANLLVMGAYSHSRWREMILGGVTRHVLEHTEVPVLMAH